MHETLLYDRRESLIGDSIASDFPVATVKKLMKNAGVDRASDDAAAALSEAMAEIGFKISRNAVELMAHAKRKTVTGEDIRLSASRG